MVEINNFSNSFGDLSDFHHYLYLRGVSCELGYLPTSGASSTLALKAIPNTKNLFSPNRDRWELVEVPCEIEDPSASILNNQEKLRDYSAHKYGSTNLEERVGSTGLLGSESTKSPYDDFASSDMVGASLEILNAVGQRNFSNICVNEKLFSSPLIPDSSGLLVALRDIENPITIREEIIMSSTEKCSLFNAIVHNSEEKSLQNDRVVNEGIQPVQPNPSNRKISVEQKAQNSLRPYLSSAVVTEEEEVEEEGSLIEFVQRFSMTCSAGQTNDEEGNVQLQKPRVDLNPNLPRGEKQEQHTQQVSATTVPSGTSSTSGELPNTVGALAEGFEDLDALIDSSLVDHLSGAARNSPFQNSANSLNKTAAKAFGAVTTSLPEAYFESLRCTFRSE